MLLVDGKMPVAAPLPHVKQLFGVVLDGLTGVEIVDQTAIETVLLRIVLEDFLKRGGIVIVSRKGSP